MKRKWNLALPAGFLLTLVSFFSYFFFLADFPVTRDFPWLSLLLFAAALGLAGLGLQRAFRQPEVYRGRISGPVLAALSLLVFGVFLAYNFHLSAQLPASKAAPRVGEKAPEFTLPDQNGKPVRLAELLAPAAESQEPNPTWVLLIFYRGTW